MQIIILVYKKLLLFQQCLNVKSGGEDGFKGQYFYVRLNEVAEGEEVVEELSSYTDIPRGGAYWTQDILERLDTTPRSVFIGSMAQRVGGCFPSGCTVEDANLNYRDEQKICNPFSVMTIRFLLP